MFVMDVLKQAIKDVKPSDEEVREVNSKINEFLSRVNKGLKGAKAYLGGSGAKGTWLADAHDADVFVAYEYKKYYSLSDELSEELEKHIKKIFPKYIRLHGSRDYFQVKENGFTFEIVPILKISKAEDAGNITDVSLLHSKWVVSQIKKKPSLADEIRLVKKFCKANNVYGAESYISGFSGYICEILTIYYGSFRRFVNAVSKWDGKVVIDAAKYYKNKEDVLFNINNSKLEGPLVVVDPVQKDRNAAAALSFEKFHSLVSLCKKFVAKPSLKMLEKDEVTVDKLRKKAGKNKLIVIDVFGKRGKEDVVGCKLLKVYEFILKEVSGKDFKIKDSGWVFDRSSKALMWWIVDSKKLSSTVVVKGPPKEMEKHVKDFKKKYKKIYFSKGHAMAKVKRKYTDVSKLVKDLIKDKYVKEKISKIKIL